MLFSFRKNISKTLQTGEQTNEAKHNMATDKALPLSSEEPDAFAPRNGRAVFVWPEPDRMPRLTTRSRPGVQEHFRCHPHPSPPPTPN